MNSKIAFLGLILKDSISEYSGLTQEFASFCDFWRIFGGDRHVDGSFLSADPVEKDKSFWQLNGASAALIGHVVQIRIIYFVTLKLARLQTAACGSCSERCFLLWSAKDMIDWLP